MKQLIAIIGPRRSGLHAVANWLIGHHQGRVRFINDPPINLPPDSKNLNGCYEYDVRSDKINLRPTSHYIQRQANQFNRSIAVNLPWPWNGIARRILDKYWEPRIKQESCIIPVLDDLEDTAPDTHIVLFENLTPQEAAHALPTWLANYRHQEELPSVVSDRLFIVLRTPWNCLASSLQRPMKGPPRPVLPEGFGDLWASYAKELTGESQHLTPNRWQIHPLLYDDWIKTPVLRSDLARTLGLTPTDRGLAQASTHGGGSSFAGQEREPSSTHELTNRWRHYQEHPLMKELFASSQIHRLTKSLKMTMPDAD